MTDLYHIASTASPDHALYDKQLMRAYIKERNDFIKYVDSMVTRRDLTDTQKIASLMMHPGRFLR